MPNDYVRPEVDQYSNKIAQRFVTARESFPPF
jgi:hypothetical protein